MHEPTTTTTTKVQFYFILFLLRNLIELIQQKKRCVWNHDDEHILITNQTQKKGKRIP